MSYTTLSCSKVKQARLELCRANNRGAISQNDSRSTIRAVLPANVSLGLRDKLAARALTPHCQPQQRYLDDHQVPPPT